MSNRKTDLKKLTELIEGIETAMLTTIGKNRHLVSRPLRTQQIGDDGALWFITNRHSCKADEIKMHPQVNVAYASASANTYISVAGKASLVFDKARIHQLWSPAMDVFYPEGKDDPEICLLKVEMESAEYWEGPSTYIGKALYFVIAAITEDPTVLSANESMRIGKKS